MWDSDDVTATQVSFDLFTGHSSFSTSVAARFALDKAAEILVGVGN